MTQMAFYFDSSCCSGCKACQAACKDKNSLKVGMLWRRVYEVQGGGWKKQGAAWVSDVYAYNVSMACNHCEDAPCQRVCPTGAIYTTPEGVVHVHSNRCVGCKYCIEACPYKVRILDHHRGIVIKCWFCLDLVRKGGEPACVTTCPTQVRIFGDLDDPGSRISRFIAEHRAQPLRPDLNTRPKIFYKRS